MRYDGKVYFLIRRTEDASICVYPTKYLKHKTTSNRSPNTVKRIAFSLSYFMGYLKEQGRQFEDVYEMTYSAQMEFFQNFLYWVKGGKHISGEVRKIPDNGTCNAYLHDVFGFYQFLEMEYEQFGSLLVLSDKTISYTNAIGVRKTKLCRSFDGYLNAVSSKGRTIERKNIIVLLDACTNCRDQLLLLLLAETGFRIGELLGVRYVEDIRAVRRFSEFLAKRNPEIKSLGEVGRLNIEEYLTYINLERGQERNLKTEMANLKNMLQQVGKVIDKPKLGKLFIKQDMPKAPEVAFKIYSDEEIKRLNYYIVNMEEQVARALILHQMLGGRISDTLTLRTDCLYQENGHYIVRMYQVKTSYYEKPIPDDVAKLIQKSMEYTYERYGETEYVFVNESNPSLPFQYSMLKHRVYTLIHENDICKDNGERMGFATHLFRHCYGMKLVELHLDDAAIAHLLGHRGVNTVYRYRRASGKLLVKETEELRKTMDEILSEIIKEWDGYEQVFQNG